MDEYIEREALMKNFCGYDLTKCVKYGNKDANQQHDSYSTMMMYEIASEIEDAPAADVSQVRHGIWIESQRLYYGAKQYECSLCWAEEFWDKHEITEKYPCCPNCGAKMGKEDSQCDT